MTSVKDDDIYVSVSNISSNATLQPKETLVFELHVIDMVIIAFYMILSIGMGLYLSKKHQTASDYFLAGRSTTWPFIGMSLYASNISSSSLVAAAGEAYNTGIAVHNYGWVANMLLILYSIIFIPTIIQLKLYTMPEFLERRYNTAARYYLSILTIFLNIVGGISGSLFAGALVVKMIFPQLELWHTIAILAVVAGIYTISGGLAAVIYTDALQTVVLLIGSVMIAIYTLIEVGGWSHVREVVPPEHLSLIRPVDDPSVPWTGLISGLPILGIYYWSCHQTIVQRIFSSKDTNHGRLGCLFTCLLNLPGLFIMTLPGIMARVIFPDLPKPDLVYPSLLFKLLPTGVKGIVLSGFLAALMSQVDSVLNSTSTLVTMDFIQKFKPGLTERQLMNIGRVLTFVFMVISVCWTPLLERFASLFQYLQKVLAYLIPPVVAIYLGGFFWKGANTRGCMITLILGNIWGAAFFLIVEILLLFETHFLHVAAILFVLSFAVLIGVSLISDDNPSKEQINVTWSSEYFVDSIVALKEVPFWKNYLFYSVLMVIIVLTIVGIFW